MENPKESDLALLFIDLSQNEKHFEIKPPLAISHKQSNFFKGHSENNPADGKKKL